MIVRFSYDNAPAAKYIEFKNIIIPRVDDDVSLNIFRKSLIVEFIRFEYDDNFVFIKLNDKPEI